VIDYRNIAAVLREDIAKALAKLREQDAEIARLRKWTPVAESQPAPDVEVLGWHPDDKVRTWLIATGVTVFGVAWSNWQPTDTEDYVRVLKPTHWRPLPSPPASA
jgi:hypothetical protein